ncbi:hypothetical protein EIP86_006493 [Pleurotus ostreatoroseus]|nr:hypothetical protein EIP86_006493 [Pleurotus ostreatoroseus]
MKFSLSSLIVLATGLGFVAAQEFECCIWGPPSSCTVKREVVERAPQTIGFGPGPECCCKPDDSGACDHCVPI